MKMFKNIRILFLICMMSQSINASNLLYQKNIAHNSPQAAQRLVEESFITPEMQWSVLSFLGKQEMVINPSTGQVQNLPTADVILQAINQKLSQQMNNAQKQTVKNAAQALLEATDIALFVTSIEAVYQPHNNLASNQLIERLNAQKQNVNNTLTAINKITTLDQASTSSYFSWVPYFGSGSSQQIIPMSIEQIQFNPTTQSVAIPASLMPTIVKVNNYKEASSDPVQAANLLFKECFIAQQHHLKDAQRTTNLKINLQSPISAQNYIFTQFPNLYDAYTANYPICQIAQQMVASHAPRYNLQAPLSPAQQQAHELLLHIRQAIQTALYIANKNSNYNAGSMLSSSVTSWLDGIVSQLMKCDSYLAQLCKDPMYGATQVDIDLDQSWSNSAKIAGGALLLGTALALDHVYGFGIGSAVYSGVASSGSTAAEYAKNLVPGAISKLVGTTQSTTPPSDKAPAAPLTTTGLPTDSRFLPTNNSTAPATAGTTPAPQKSNGWFGSGTNDANKPAPTWIDRGKQAWGIASQVATGAATIGGVTMMASRGAQQAEQAGYLAPGTYQSVTGGYGNTIEKGAITAMTVGGSISAINGGIGAWNKWGTKDSLNQNAILPAKFWDTLDLIQAAPGAAGAGFGILATANALASQGFSTLTAQNHMNQQRAQQAPVGQQAAPVQQITPQQIYEVLQSNSAQSEDPFGTLVAGIKIVGEQRMADPQTILMILEQIKIDTAENPEFSNKVGELAQTIAQNIQQAA